MDIYALKREYGVCGTVCQTTNQSPNYETGQITSTLTSTYFDFVIAGSNKISLKQLLDSSIFGQSKPDTIYQNDREFIIDLDDAPSGFVLTTSDYIIIENKRYDVSYVDVTTVPNVLYFRATEVKGPATKIISVNVVEYVKINSEVA